jgi:Subtilase family
MADERPLLRGKIERQEHFQDPRGGGGGDIALPPRDRKYRRRIAAEMESIAAALRARKRDPDASRLVIAAIPLDHQEALEADRLGDKRTDARVVAVDPDTGMVILDVADADLGHLRRKLEEFEKSGKHEPLFGLLEHLRVADHAELAGPEAAALGQDDTTVRWFEVGCRGGVRGRLGETANSRGQVLRQFHAANIVGYHEYEATEQLVFFVHTSVLQLRSLVGLVDCVYEYELAPPDVRDWLIIEHVPAGDVSKFVLAPPASDAPAVALLDTGVATKHPVLISAVRVAQSVVPEDDSPEDTHSHGTEMAGIALYPDLGAAISTGLHAATHWLESSRLLTAPRIGSASEDQRSYWPTLTTAAVQGIEDSDTGARLRAFCLAVTAPLKVPKPTVWSHALDRLAFNDGRGRLFCVSAGNADVGDLELLRGYPTLHLQQPVEDPAQAANVLTVGAFTRRTRLPPERHYAGKSALAPEGGVSPWTRAGAIDDHGRPDVVFEGGNLAFDGVLQGVGVETLSGLTTGRDFTRKPLSLIWGTSEAAAHAARDAVAIWRDNRDLRPETVRGLLVHAASWTSAMYDQFPNVGERMRVCGYGAPDLEFARACAAARATVVVEDEMPNAVYEEVPRTKVPKRESTRQTEDKVRRLVKFFRLPVPELDAFEDPNREVELRVTLSYFAEPNTFRRRVYYGLNLRWDMQGPLESEEQFRQRINKLARGASKPTSESFDWDVKIQRRGRGTVQSDRWRGPASMLADPKLLAVMPVLGWWHRRKELQGLSQPFSLIVSIVAEGMDIYTPIEAAISVPVQIET